MSQKICAIIDKQFPAVCPEPFSPNPSVKTSLLPLLPTKAEPETGLRVEQSDDYSERRKLRTSCCWLGVRSLSKISSTVCASPPLLSWASMAQSRLVQRPSCRKKIRCPRPHRGAERNWSPPAPPWETLSASTLPM